MKYERHRSRSSSEKHKSKRSSQQSSSKDLMRGSTFKSELAKIQNHQPKCFKKEEDSFTASASSSFSTPSKTNPSTVMVTPKLEDVIDSGANTTSSPSSNLGLTDSSSSQMIICPPPPPPPLPPELLSPPPLPREESNAPSQNSMMPSKSAVEPPKQSTSGSTESSHKTDRTGTSKLTSFPMPPPNMILPPSDSEASSETSGGSVSDSSDSDGDDSSPNSKQLPPKASDTIKSNGSTSGRKSLVEDLPLPKFISELSISSIFGCHCSIHFYYFQLLWMIVSNLNQKTERTEISLFKIAFL